MAGGWRVELPCQGGPGHLHQSRYSSRHQCVYIYIYVCVCEYADAGHSDEALVAAMTQDILARLPPAFDVEKAQAKYPVKYEESMNQVGARWRGTG